MFFRFYFTIVQDHDVKHVLLYDFFLDLSLKWRLWGLPDSSTLLRKSVGFGLDAHMSSRLKIISRLGVWVAGLNQKWKKKKKTWLISNLGGGRRCIKNTLCPSSQPAHPLVCPAPHAKHMKPTIKLKNLKSNISYRKPFGSFSEPPFINAGGNSDSKLLFGK